MIFTQRRAMLWLLIFQFSVGVVALIYFQFWGNDPNTLVGLYGSVPLIGVLTIAYWKGFEWVRYVNIVGLSLLVALFLITPEKDGSFAPIIFAPLALALIAASPAWMLGIAIGIIAVLLLRAGGTTIYGSPEVLLAYTFVSGCLILGRLIVVQAQRATEAALQQAQDERQRANEAAATAEQRAREVSAQNEQQRRLLDLIATLEVPVVTLAEGVLLSSLVGHVDTQRAAAIMQRLLQAVYQQRAQLIVIDVSGIAVADEAVVQVLLDLARGIQLLGCKVTLSGIAANSAAFFAEHGVALAGIGTAKSPQDALRRAGWQAAGARN